MKITDKRHGSRSTPSSSRIIVATRDSDVRKHTAEVGAAAALDRGRALGPAPTDEAQARKGVLQRMGSSGNVNLSRQKPRDLEFWWRRNNDFYDTDTDDGLKNLRAICARLYSSHPLIGTAVDIYSKWPIVGAEFVSKDEKLVEFYSDLFFDTLDYEEFLVDIGREYWSVGEALPLGTWNETLGVWEADELVHPDEVQIHKSPFSKDPRFEMKVPKDIREIVRRQQPREEYEALIANYPDLVEFAMHGDQMPVSNHLLKQIKFKGQTFHDRGISIMTRGIRAVLQEEMLNSAQDSIGDRMSTPFLLARLGATSQELGGETAWVPTVDEIANFEDLFDAALAADFRMMTTHFGVKVDSIFGREAMPNLNTDFERLGERILQVYGLSKTMLSGGAANQTYASDALNRDLITQLMHTYQRRLKRFVRERMLIVAEAQGHYDYEERGGKRYPIMQEVLEVDANGVRRVVEKPKLLVPELRLKPMNMKDEEAEEKFYQALAAAGAPVSMRTRFATSGIDFDEQMEQVREEKVALIVEEQKARKAAYEALLAQRLPIPEDLDRDFGAKVENPEEIGAAPAGQAAPLTEGDQAPDVLSMETLQTPLMDNNVIPMPTNQVLDPEIEGRSRPEESDEMRAHMPTAQVKISRADGAEEVKEFDRGLITGPRHIGLSRFAGLSSDRPLPDDESDDESEVS